MNECIKSVYRHYSVYGGSMKDYVALLDRNSLRGVFIFSRTS